MRLGAVRRTRQANTVITRVKLTVGLRPDSAILFRRQFNMATSVNADSIPLEKGRAYQPRYIDVCAGTFSFSSWDREANRRGSSKRSASILQTPSSAAAIMAHNDTLTTWKGLYNEPRRSDVRSSWLPAPVSRAPETPSSWPKSSVSRTGRPLSHRLLSRTNNHCSRDRLCNSRHPPLQQLHVQCVAQAAP
jgi:hypothetical protein